MRVDLDNHQAEALGKLSSGKVLYGGVGTGKSRTALAYFFIHECGGMFDMNGLTEVSEMTTPKDIYVITTARKRDSLDWEGEAAMFSISTDPSLSFGGVRLTVDSWNNIHKYVDVDGAFFVFDEQRLVGSGKWVKSFLKIAKRNTWLLLSGTPGDQWIDYCPVFIANGLYRNRTEFMYKHVVFKWKGSYQQIDRYVDTSVLERHRRNLLVPMPMERGTTRRRVLRRPRINSEGLEALRRKKMNPRTLRPCKDPSEVRREAMYIAFSDPSRLEIVEGIAREKRRVILFYNYDYELEILRNGLPGLLPGWEFAEWNGKRHQEVPDSEKWVYIVQYTAGAEAWNCVSTDTIVFYSLNYSWRIMEQAEGRIDRLNTKFKDLWYYLIVGDSWIEGEIMKTLKRKKRFNMNAKLGS